MASGTVSATEFKAKCLEILDRIGRRELASVAITKRGKVVAVLVPPAAAPAEIGALHGCLRGSVVIPDGLDLTAPILDEEFAAASGDLHR